MSGGSRLRVSPVRSVGTVTGSFGQICRGGDGRWARVSPGSWHANNIRFRERGGVEDVRRKPPFGTINQHSLPPAGAVLAGHKDSLARREREFVRHFRLLTRTVRFSSILSAPGPKNGKKKLIHLIPRALSDQRAHIPGHSPQDIVPARQSITLPFRGSPGPLRWSMAGTLTLKPKQAQQGFGR
jgi:hypothetical protein